MKIETFSKLKSFQIGPFQANPAYFITSTKCYISYMVDQVVNQR